MINPGIPSITESELNELLSSLAKQKPKNLTDADSLNPEPFSPLYNRDIWLTDKYPQQFSAGYDPDLSCFHGPHEHNYNCYLPHASTTWSALQDPTEPVTLPGIPHKSRVTENTPHFSEKKIPRQNLHHQRLQSSCDFVVALDDVQALPICNYSKEEIERLECTLCHKNFSRIYDLRRHQKILHFGGRLSNILCDRCGKSFSRSDSLKRHRAGCK